MPGGIVGVFTERESAALAPRKRVTPSEWGDENRYLPGSVAAEPGRYRGDRVPYMAGIIDAVLEDCVEEIVVIKAAQIAFTTGIQNLIGWCVDQEPGPMLLVMPSEDESGNIVEEQLRPLIENCPRLQELLCDDGQAITKHAILFDTMPIYLGWSGSAQSLARRACRYVILDEVDKYKSFSGRDAAPIPLARKRTSTFQHRARVIMGSSPTTADGAIAVAYSECGDHRQFHVPCPYCNGYQTLAFGQLRFDSDEIKAIQDRARKADFILETDAAFYECRHCKGAILEKQKPQMLRQGVWLSDNQTIDKSGRVLGNRPVAKRVGFQISAMYSPWVSFSRMAAQFVRSLGDYGAMMEFKNQWLGEVFENLDSAVKFDELTPELAAAAPPAGIVPKWAGVLLATVDVHDTHLDFVIRAHGRDDRSQLVHEGEASTFGDITKICLDSVFQIEASEEVLSVDTLFIDAGYRTDEVYEFSKSDGRIKPTLGARDYFPSKVMTWKMVSQELGVNVGTIDTQYYKTKLATLRHSGKWLINNRASPEYLRHMASEHKVIDRKSGKSIWQKISSGTPNHRFDCEVYQLAAADFVQANLLPDEATLVKIRDDAAAQRKNLRNQALRPSSSWLGNTKKWLRVNRSSNPST
jgi:phage terminase large subunit GpA-like protein